MEVLIEMREENRNREVARDREREYTTDFKLANRVLRRRSPNLRRQVTIILSFLLRILLSYASSLLVFITTLHVLPNSPHLSIRCRPLIFISISFFIIFVNKIPFLLSSQFSVLTSLDYGYPNRAGYFGS